MNDIVTLEPNLGAAAAPALLAHATDATRAGDSVSIGHLRAFLTVLVVAHHAALAYNPIAQPPAASLLDAPRTWAVFPVVAAARSNLLALFTSFNDVFFMSLMFFVSGLFAWKSLMRKGSAAFLRDRVVRLGLPFVVAATLIAPLAYYPAYLQTGAREGLAGFARQWLSLGEWPAGPAWFLWVLLAFDGLAALLFAVAPRSGEALRRACDRGPLALFALVVGVSAAAYLPLALAIDPFRWSGVGPFWFQTSRILHYAVYFFFGVGVGAGGLDAGPLAPGGPLAERWVRWGAAALVAFASSIVLFLIAVSARSAHLVWSSLGGLGFVVSCAASSFAFLAVFGRFAQRRGRVSDSLRANAYGVYLLHYALVSWIGLALVSAPLPALLKASIVTIGAVGASWGASAALRRIPAVAHVV